MSACRPVSVIVLTWNGLEYTQRCIESIFEKTTHPHYEIIVVDNGSTDGTVEYLKSVEGVKLIENKENLGFVKGNNVGINNTSNDVVLMNNDTEIIEPDWLERIQSLVYSSPDIGIAGCRLINGDGLLVHAGTYMPVPSYWGQEYPGGEVDIGQYTADREVEGVIFACVYIKRALIEAVGLLDEDYFSYYEDTDYCLKAKEAGFRVFCCGSVTVKHYENVSIALNRADFSSNFKRSRDVFISKWGEYFTGKYRHKIGWCSRFTPGSMFFEISRKMIHSLDRAGVDVNLGASSEGEKLEFDDFLLNEIKMKGWDNERAIVQFCPEEELSPRMGSYNIAYVFTPYSDFAKSFVDRLNKMDEVWVPSEFQKCAAIESGVKRDIFVVPFGIDFDYFHPRIKSYRLSGRFTFLCSTAWGDESCAQALVEAFAEEFEEGEDVVLIMNIGSGTQRGSAVSRDEGGPDFGLTGLERDTERMGITPGRAHVVFLVGQEIPAYQRPSLIRSADCVLVVERSSENALDVSSSLACGVPAIVLDWGSAAELVDGRAVYGVKCAPLSSPSAGLTWAEADKDDLRRKMRAAFESGESLNAAAFEKSKWVQSKYGWESIANLVVRRLEEIA